MKAFLLKISLHELRSDNSFQKRKVNSIWHGTESVSCLAPNIWNLVPNEIKQCETLNAFKFRSKRWVHDGCPTVFNEE